jgi:hypothetical protein
VKNNILHLSSLFDHTRDLKKFERYRPSGSAPSVRTPPHRTQPAGKRVPRPGRPGGLIPGGRKMSLASGCDRSGFFPDGTGASRNIFGRPRALKKICRGRGSSHFTTRTLASWDLRNLPAARENLVFFTVKYPSST